VGRQTCPTVVQAGGQEPRFPTHSKASLIAPHRLFLSAKPLSPAGSVLFCSASLLRKTLPAQPQNGVLSSSHPPALDFPARDAGQPTPVGSCRTALSCGCWAASPCHRLAAVCTFLAPPAAPAPVFTPHPGPHRQELGAVGCLCSPEMLASGQGAAGGVYLHLAGLLLAVHVAGSPVLLPLRTPFVPQ